MVAACDLRGCMTLTLRSSSLTRPNPGQRQEAPFPPGGMASTLNDPSKLACSFLLRKVDGRLLRFAMDAGAYHGARLGDGETRCSKVRSNHPSKLACTSLRRGGLGCFQLRASTTRPVIIQGGWWNHLRLAVGARPRRCGRLYRWRDALFDGPFGRSPGQTELRSQAATGPCVSFEPIRWSSTHLRFTYPTIRFDPFGVRLRRARESQPVTPLVFRRGEVV